MLAVFFLHDYLLGSNNVSTIMYYQLLGGHIRKLLDSKQTDESMLITQSMGPQKQLMSTYQY